jgi:glycosyltransferase involved in cell wall biosynthesis
LKIVTHPVNRGYGGALRTGFASASKDVIFYTDGDAQYDPSEIELLWPMMTAGVDLVNGYKISRSDPLHRIVIGRIYHHTVRSCSAFACATSIAIFGCCGDRFSIACISRKTAA